MNNPQEPNLTFITNKKFPELQLVRQQRMNGTRYWHDWIFVWRHQIRLKLSVQHREYGYVYIFSYTEESKEEITSHYGFDSREASFMLSHFHKIAPLLQMGFVIEKNNHEYIIMQSTRVFGLFVMYTRAEHYRFLFSVMCPKWQAFTPKKSHLTIADLKAGIAQHQLAIPAKNADNETIFELTDGTLIFK